MLEWFIIKTKQNETKKKINQLGNNAPGIVFYVSTFQYK